MKLNTIKFCVATALIGSTTVSAQTERAVERRSDRSERRVERQVERANYFTDEAWEQVNSWTQQNGIKAQQAFNRVDRALDNAANAAQRAANLENASDRIDANRGQNDADLDSRGGINRKDGESSSYGYRDSSDDARWFYDYYTIVPTYSQSTVRIAEIEDIETLKDDEMTDRVSVTGEIEAVKKAKVGDHEHLVVKISTNDENIDAVDLGRESNTINASVHVGDKIKASGWVEEIGEMTVLIARNVKVGDQSETITREMNQSLDGVVIDVKEVEVESAQHFIAVVESNDQRTLVDLGPVNKYEFKIKPESKIVVHGMPVRTNNQVLVMAKEVNLDGKTFKIQ